MDKKVMPSSAPAGHLPPGEGFVPVTVGQAVRFTMFEGMKGERGDCCRGGRKEPSEWPRSVCDAAAPPARRKPGTATGEGAVDLRREVEGVVESVNHKHRTFTVRYGDPPMRTCFQFFDINVEVFPCRKTDRKCGK